MYIICVFDIISAFVYCKINFRDNIILKYIYLTYFLITAENYFFSAFTI